MDATTPHGKAMLHMAAVFAELERGMIRERVMAGLERAQAQGVTLGRPRVARKVENAIRTRLARGEGILRVAKGPRRRRQHRPADQGGERGSPLKGR
jgi:DNA invertase Pin-like site-specific DNA recombinase